MLSDSERLNALLWKWQESATVIVSLGRRHPRDDPGQPPAERIVEASPTSQPGSTVPPEKLTDVEESPTVAQGSDTGDHAAPTAGGERDKPDQDGDAGRALGLSELDGWWDEAYAPDSVGTRPRHLGRSSRRGPRRRGGSPLLDLLDTRSCRCSSIETNGSASEWLESVVESIKYMAPGVQRPAHGARVRGALLPAVRRAVRSAATGRSPTHPAAEGRHGRR